MVKSKVRLHVPGKLLSLVLLIILFHSAICLECDSCGKECIQSCGTKLFRNCCYNYLRKRSGSAPISAVSGYRHNLIMVGPETIYSHPYFKHPLKRRYEEENTGESYYEIINRRK